MAERQQSFTPTGFDAPTRSVKVSGVDYEAPLSPEERELQRRLFASVATLPEEFKAWVPQHQAVNGLPIPASQVLGSSSLGVSVATSVDTLQTTTSASYTNLATTGPQITGLRNGLYVVLFGCQINVPNANETARATVKVNSAAASDTYNVLLGQDAASGAALAISTSRTAVLELTDGNNNTLLMQYRGTNGGSVGFSLRWMIAIRYGNA